VLFESGASVDECVRQSSYARSTIAGHLGDWIAETKPASIRPWVDEPTEQRIRAAIDSVEHEGRLRPIFEALNEDVPYDLIRIVLKSL
jgi:ATP-dependent DNA helicase RecQ